MTGAYIFNELYSIGQVLLSMCLGAIIGWEREMYNKPAGLRTQMLVAGASSLFVILSVPLTNHFLLNVHNSDVIDSDPIRIIQAIAVGVSFLGAGTIIHDQAREVKGLTTAATLLLSSTIGIAVAVGKFFLAACITLIAFLVLQGMGKIERHMRKRQI